MLPSDWIQLIFFIAFLIITTPIIGTYLAQVFNGKTSTRNPLYQLEQLTYRLAGITPSEEMNGYDYLKSLVVFNLLGLLALILMQIFQYWLPLNPQNFSGLSWSLAFNTAASFVTNTNWQAYSGETTLSYLTQMMGLSVQNFLSAATGTAVFLALVRGLTRKFATTIGNFWVDMTRTVIYILLPGSIILALFLVSEGVIQSAAPYLKIETLEEHTQTIPMGPVASQVAIKQLGTNGGGFFNANSAHPFENPTPLSNFIELFAIICLPAALTYTYGILIGSKRDGWLLFNVMLLVWGIGLAISTYSENLYNPILNSSQVFEGKEVRLSLFNDVIWSTSTTAAASGSVNAMLDSYSPLSGGIALFNIMLGENIFGGIGVGMCSMIMSVLLTVFLSGLMVGRTPEYLGKKIEKRTMQWVMVSLLVPIFTILIGTSIALNLPNALESLSNKGPHGFSQILYAFTSASGNNGSAFGGLNANTSFFNIVLGLIMIIARFAIIVPTLAIAGELVKKNISPPSVGTLQTDNILFALLLISVILIVGALTYLPALALGPIVEHFIMLQGESF